ncbi:hypothetical protein AABC73_17085 [Pseudomonas sp. G.S.17]|uniref:hypothetical protein n=1 Tax=Pseudomonas sp. G.S.17 TaxID=3137451 RepID=UPI00311C8DE1
MKVAGSNSQIRRDLQGISSDLKWSSVELSRIAGRLEAAGNSADAQAIQRMMQIFQEGEVRLNHIACTISGESLVTQVAV